MQEIASYLNGGGPFSHLVSRIDEHIRAFDSMPNADVEKLRNVWIKLETINALGLSEGIDPAAPHERKEVEMLLASITQHLGGIVSQS